MKTKVFGWIELIIVSFFTLGLAVNAWPIALPLSQKFAADTGAEDMAIMLAGMMILVPFLMFLRLRSRIEGYYSEPGVVTAGVGVAVLTSWCAVTPWLYEASESIVILSDSVVAFLLLCVTGWHLFQWLETCHLPDHFHQACHEARRIKAPV